MEASKLSSSNVSRNLTAAWRLVFSAHDTSAIGFWRGCLGKDFGSAANSRPHRRAGPSSYSSQDRQAFQWPHSGYSSPRLVGFWMGGSVLDYFRCFAGTGASLFDALRISLFKVLLNVALADAQVRLRGGFACLSIQLLLQSRVTQARTILHFQGRRTERVILNVDCELAGTSGRINYVISIGPRCCFEREAAILNVHARILSLPNAAGTSESLPRQSLFSAGKLSLFRSGFRASRFPLRLQRLSQLTSVLPQEDLLLSQSPEP